MDKFVIDTSMSAKTNLVGMGQKNTLKARSVILERRGKSIIEACSDGEEISMEDIWKEKEVAMAVKKKGGRS